MDDASGPNDPAGGVADDSNATIDAAIRAAANTTSFADRLAARGVTTVVLDGEGNLVRRSPDGTTTPL